MIFDLKEANDKNEHDGRTLLRRMQVHHRHCMHRAFAELACLAREPQEHKKWQLSAPRCHSSAWKAAIWQAFRRVSSQS
jgi:hypothetical protein